jgi:hypothetical protein
MRTSKETVNGDVGGNKPCCLYQTISIIVVRPLMAEVPKKEGRCVGPNSVKLSRSFIDHSAFLRRVNGAESLWTSGGIQPLIGPHCLKLSAPHRETPSAMWNLAQNHNIGYRANNRRGNWHSDFVVVRNLGR